MCIPSGKRWLQSFKTVVIMTTAKGMQPTFSGSHIQLFYHFRSLRSTHGNCRSEYRHRTKYFKVHYTPFTLNENIMKSWALKRAIFPLCFQNYIFERTFFLKKSPFYRDIDRSNDALISINMQHNNIRYGLRNQHTRIL